MSLFHPRVGRYLVTDQGEVIVDEVRKHWAALIVPWLEVAAGGVVLIIANASPRLLAIVLALAGAVALLHGGWRVLGQYRDLFVITNMRVFRVHGILDQQIATMPLTRILDVSVYKPFIGRILGYGDFVFESAAQAQGLREIHFVGRPDARGLTIQRVITQAGLRGRAGMSMDVGAGAAMTAPPVPDGSPGVEADRRELAWLLTALRREHERLASQGRGDTRPVPPASPDKTDTAPLDTPR